MIKSNNHFGVFKTVTIDRSDTPPDYKILPYHIVNNKSLAVLLKKTNAPPEDAINQYESTGEA